jgi:hypothetical protein
MHIGQRGIHRGDESLPLPALPFGGPRWRGQRCGKPPEIGPQPLHHRLHGGDLGNLRVFRLCAERRILPTGQRLAILAAEMAAVVEAAVVEVVVVTTEHPKKAPPRPQVQDWPRAETVDCQPTKAPDPRKSGCSLGRAPPKLPSQDVHSAMHVRRPGNPSVSLVASGTTRPAYTP